MSIKNKTICPQQQNLRDENIINFVTISEKGFGRFFQFCYRSFGGTSKIAKLKVTSILAASCDQVTLRVEY